MQRATSDRTQLPPPPAALPVIRTVPSALLPKASSYSIAHPKSTEQHLLSSALVQTCKAPHQAAQGLVQRPLKHNNSSSKGQAPYRDLCADTAATLQVQPLATGQQEEMHMPHKYAAMPSTGLLWQPFLQQFTTFVMYMQGSTWRVCAADTHTESTKDTPSTHLCSVLIYHVSSSGLRPLECCGARGRQYPHNPFDICHTPRSH